MFDNINTTLDSLVAIALVVMISSVVLGVALAYFYMFVKREDGYVSDFPWTMAIMPPVVAVLIIMLANNLAAGIAVGGLFALTRFRSNQRNTEDIAYVLLTVVIGVIAGTGYVAFALIFTLFMMAVILVLYFLRFGKTSEKNLALRIVVPESLNYENLFDDLLKKYCLSYAINRVRTIDFGTLFELTYHIVIKKSTKQKEMVDELRQRNGNLTITLTVQRFNQVD
ncbi:MAG: DUF4956 domain-containing protein [Bacilli bacterium]